MDTRPELEQSFATAMAGLEPEGRPPTSFGGYLVERAAIDRFQLLRALQMQDFSPGARLGECIAALGFLPYAAIQRHLESWHLHQGPRAAIAQPMPRSTASP